MLSFLKNLIGLGPSFRTPSEAHPLLGPAAKSAKSGDVRALMQLFANPAQDPSVRYASVGACKDSYYAGSEHAAPMYEAWINASPNDVFGRLVRAAFLLDQVPGYSPEDADKNQKIAEGDRLRSLAANDLQVARNVAPQDPVVDTFVLDGQQPHETDEDLYNSIVARAPTLLAAHRNMFWAHTQRWGGEPGAALQFGREVANRTRGSELPLMIMYAHWENHWYLESMCSDAAGARALLADPNVRNECLAVYNGTLAAPGHVATVNTWWFRQLASRWFYLAGKANSDPNDTARAKNEIERLADVFVPEDSLFWWMSAEKYGELRKELGIV